jgi:GT2 family glycosyltransferase
LRLRGKEVHYLPSAAAFHLCGASSENAPYLSILAFHRSVFRYYWKWNRSFPARILSPVVALGLMLRCGLKSASRFLGSLVGSSVDSGAAELARTLKSIEARRRELEQGG